MVRRITGSASPNDRIIPPVRSHVFLPAERKLIPDNKKEAQVNAPLSQITQV